ncbi:MAG TPA: class I SAM-dependent methyltransferase, partial [Chroococcidiopsis sp.]
MPNSTPLHTLNPRQRFSNRADDYAKYRPSYPAEAIAAMLAGLGESGNLPVADVGAGTGISSRLLAAQGANVWAIEPNAAMREAAIAHPAVEFCAATAEATGLPDQSVQLVTCCQAFHWFEPVATLAEFQRILQPHGRVALMWNERDLSDPFTHGYTEAIRKAADQHFFDRPDRRSASALERSP